MKIICRIPSWALLLGLVLSSHHLDAAACGAHQVLHTQLGALSPWTGAASYDLAPAGDAGFLDTEAADDVLLPANEVWSVDQVEVEFTSMVTEPPAPESVEVTVYRDSGNLPGVAVCKHLNLSAALISSTSNTRRLRVDLPTPCMLCAGTRYWVALQAGGGSAGSFAWRQRTGAQDPPSEPAKWRSAAGGLGGACTSWGNAVATCGMGDQSSPELSFSISGQSWQPGAVKGDMDGDLCPDLIFQNLNPSGRQLPTRQIKIWTMNGPVRVAESFVDAIPPSPWEVVGADDLEVDADSRSDLVLQEKGTTGIVQFWYMDGSHRTGSVIVTDTPPPGNTSWTPTYDYAAPDRHLVGSGRFLPPAVVAPFAGGGGPSVVCMAQGGGILIWNNHSNLAPTYPGGFPTSPGSPADTNWRIRCIDDFNGDGYPDFAFFNLASGKVVTWNMQYNEQPPPISGGSPQPRPERIPSSTSFLTPANPEEIVVGTEPPRWDLAASGDYGLGPDDAADAAAPLCGATDVVWQKRADGSLLLWHLDQDRHRTASVPLSNPGPGWVLVAPR